jgi:formate hydrogenlyase subunit 6/NADH:ubiquinone oxidoreductase subunit I
LHYIDPSHCIDCGACGAVCPPESILDELGDVCKALPRKNWPHAVVNVDSCIGSGCELCINVCPFDALTLEVTEEAPDHYGQAFVDTKKCTGCRLCEEACGWGAIYIEPSRPEMKKMIWESMYPPSEEELTRAAKLAGRREARAGA